MGAPGRFEEVELGGCSGEVQRTKSVKICCCVKGEVGVREWRAGVRGEEDATGSKVRPQLPRPDGRSRPEPSVALSSRVPRAPASRSTRRIDGEESQRGRRRDSARSQDQLAFSPLAGREVRASA